MSSGPPGVKRDDESESIIAPGPWIVFGLGNPGIEYRNTYHNVGFRVVETLADRWGVSSWSSPGSPGLIQARIAETAFGQARARVVLVEPWSYMNRAGQVLAPLFDRFGVESRLLVVSDDLALPVGKIRIRERGSAGGHNGLKSTSSAYGSNDYRRVRVGIDTDRPKGDTRDYVLSPVSRQDRETLGRAELLAADAVEFVISHGVRLAMSEFNGADLRDEGDQ
jgi:PTH1 family peptidyl-tRNA hydrolase